ncbi:MAG: amino acid permease [Terriglobales bacterium]
MTESNESGLHRQLGAGQIAMVAVGGSIGTGLLLGSGAAVQIAGPAVSVAYVVGALITWTVAMALGELASMHPAAGSFGVYAERYLNSWAGFVARYGYWVSVTIAVGGHLVASATYFRFWFPQVPAMAWIAIFATVLLVVNLRSVGDFGTFEYWFAMIKLVAVMTFIILGAALLTGGRVTPQFTANGGFFAQGLGAPLRAVSFALFSFLGVEMVAISSGEARSREEIPRATRWMFALLTFVYVGATVVLVGVLPWNRVGVTESPFVTVFSVAGIPAAAAVMNFVVLTAALSGANANLYVASRMLFSLARSGYAPSRLGELASNGSPRAALLVSTGGIAAAVAAQYWAPEQAYLYIILSSLFGGMLAWAIALAAHIAFRRTLATNELAALPMRSPGGAAASWLGLVGVCGVVISTWWVPQTRVTMLAGLPQLVLLSLAYVLVRRRRAIGSR